MKIEEAIEILEYHQKWRLGNEEEMLDPKKITEALDILLKEVVILRDYYDA